ncbi:hypothetical protein HDV00_012383, partial [Rhizophlyctis rosea]
MNNISNTLQTAVLNNLDIIKRSTAYGSATDESQPVATVASQFVPGADVSVLTEDLRLSLVDPGKAPFVLPADVTPASILAAQEASVAETLAYAEEQEKAAQLAYEWYLKEQLLRTEES